MAWRSGSVNSAMVRNDCAVLLIELAGRVDEAHGGFAAIDDRHPLKFVLHRVLRSPDRHARHLDYAATGSSDIAACSAFTRSASIALGSATVR